MKNDSSIFCPICGRQLQTVNFDRCPHCGFKIRNRCDQLALDENTAHDYFEWLRSLLAFLPYLRQKPEVVKWVFPKDREEGVLYAPYPDYCEELDNFYYRFHEGEKWSLPPYIKTIEERKIKLPITPESSEVKYVDMTGLLALFYWSFRGERFATGFMGRNVEDGIYVMLLERLKELLEDLGVDTIVEKFNLGSCEKP